MQNSVRVCIRTYVESTDTKAWESNCLKCVFSWYVLFKPSPGGSDNYKAEYEERKESRGKEEWCIDTNKEKSI